MIVLRIRNLSPLPATGFQIHLYDFGGRVWENGLELCSLVKPDAILLDFLLPDIDGLEFLDELKNQIGRTSLPVIMLTGQGNEAIAVQAMKSGARLFSHDPSNSPSCHPQCCRTGSPLAVRAKSDFVLPLKICWIVLAYTSVRDQSGRIIDFSIEYVRHDSVRTDWQAAARIVAV